MTLSAFSLAATDAFRPAPPAADRPIRASASTRNPWTPLRRILHGVLEMMLVSPMDSVPRIRNYPY